MKGVNSPNTLLRAEAVHAFTSVCALTGSCLWCTALLADPDIARVTARDANSSTVEWTERLTNPVTGEVTQRNHSYVTVGNGLNYQDESGTWRESQDLIELLPDGSAAALRGPHKIHFSPNLNTAGVISLTTVSNRLFRSHPLALYYLNAETGERALVARVKDSIGELHPPNQLVYPDCLEGAKADYRVTYTKGGMEADLVLLEQLPPPEMFFGTTRVIRVEWVTEFLDPPTPQIKTRILKQETDPALRQSMAEPDLIDETLDFGDAWFPLGRAFEWNDATRLESNTPAEIRVFDLASDTNQVPVAKWWLNVDQRNVMVESVDWSDISLRLDGLPQSGRVAGASKDHVAKGWQLPATKVAATKKSEKPMRVAAIPYRAKGFTLDYIVLSGSGDYTFASGVTYLIGSGGGGYWGSTVTFQPNCTIKFDNGAYLIAYTSIVCNGNAGSYSILTSKDDDLYGEQIAGSTGNPTYGTSSALWLYYVPSDSTVRYLQIRWVQTGIQFEANPADNRSHSAQSIKLQQCQYGLRANGCVVYLSGVTTCGVTTPLSVVNGGFFSGVTTVDCAGDTDSDGLPDSWETTQFGNVASQNATGDPDGDGLTNLQEYQSGTNPNWSDTDGDGLPDGWEVANAFNPNSPSDAYVDTDGDGLTNFEEFRLGANPRQGNVASISFAPVGHYYSSAQNVTITCPTTGAVIHYTTNGQEPTESDPTITSGSSILVNQSLTLKAKAWKTGWVASDTESEGYQIGGTPNQAPTLTITPPGSSSFLASDEIQILVDGSDTDGTITKIQLLHGNYKVAETASSPLNYLLENVVAGTYTFTAKAFDDFGAVTVSSPITITVNSSGPVVSLAGLQYYFTSSPGTLIAAVTGVNPGTLAMLTLNGTSLPARMGVFPLNASLVQGANQFTLVATDNQSRTAQATATIYLDSVLPTVSITAPPNNSSFNTTRVNVQGTFTEASLKRITINGVLANVSGNTFEARSVPLASGANTITATAEDLAGNTGTGSITVTQTASPVDPVLLTATPIGGFAPLNVSFIPQATVPGTIQQVLYDFEGDGVVDLTRTDLLAINHSYPSAGEFFPVVTVVTTSGRFSSLGGWNVNPSTTGGTPQLRITVQTPPLQVGSSISITDPVDLKWAGAGHLYVLSRSAASITEYDANNNIVRSVGGIGSVPRGLDVDSGGNVYVALSGDNQVKKYHPVTGTFQLDTTFNGTGYVGKADRTTGSGNGEFNAPFDVAVTPNGSEIAVSDSGNHRIQIFNAGGPFLLTFGQLGAAFGQFNTPKGLVFDSIGILYIVDAGNNRIVLAQDTGVVGLSGSAGTALGQFQGAINLGVGERGVYIADTGNNRIQKLDQAGTGEGSSLTPLNPRLALSTELGLNQPNSVTAVANLLDERMYVADTGNNRVLLIKLPNPTSNDPATVWSLMTQRLLANDIPGAIPYFSSVAADKYRDAFLSIGTTDLTPAISQIGAITPVVIGTTDAQYSFDQEVIAGITITFPINFVLENGTWKILEF